MKKLLLIVLALGIVGTPAFAVQLCTTVATTAASFQNLGNVGCQFGDKIFYDFTYSYTLQDSDGNPLAPNVPGTAVSVQFSNLGNQTFRPVVSFLANWDVIDGGQGDVRIGYTVSAPATGAMYYSSLTLSGFVSNIDPDNQFSSYISGAEGVCCPGPGNSAPQLGAELLPPPTPSGLVFVTGSDQVYYGPATQISISKDIFLSAGSNSGVPGGPPNGNEVILTRIDQGLFELTAVPEPLSFFLLGSGLISLAFLTKRARRTNTQRSKA